MVKLSDLSIGSIVEKNFRIASVLRAHKIDYLMKTDISLRSACKLNKINNIQLEKEIQKIILDNDISKIDSSCLRLDILTDYIEFNFHRYFFDQIPKIIADITNIAEDYFFKEPRFLMIRNLILHLSEHLTKRMMIEERDLFIHIRTILYEIKSSKSLNSGYGNVHAIIAAIDDKSYDFIANANCIIEQINDCFSFHNISAESTVEKLNAFNMNLIDYINTQRNLLFPKSIDLYRSLNF